MSHQQQPQHDGAVRARKPYTMTKAREKWSPEEHERFLEAIKLHGRNWKRIEGEGGGAAGGRAKGPAILARQRAPRLTRRMLWPPRRNARLTASGFRQFVSHPNPTP